MQTTTFRSRRTTRFPVFAGALADSLVREGAPRSVSLHSPAVTDIFHRCIAPPAAADTSIEHTLSSLPFTTSHLTSHATPPDSPSFLRTALVVHGALHFRVDCLLSPARPIVEGGGEKASFHSRCSSGFAWLKASLLLSAKPSRSPLFRRHSLGRNVVQSANESQLSTPHRSRQKGWQTRQTAPQRLSASTSRRRSPPSSPTRPTLRSSHRPRPNLRDSRSSSSASTRQRSVARHTKMQKSCATSACWRWSGRRLREVHQERALRRDWAARLSLSLGRGWAARSLTSMAWDGQVRRVSSRRSSCTSAHPPLLAGKGTLARLNATPEERTAREQKLADAVKVLLECIGEDPERDGLIKTPERYAKALLWMTKGYEERLPGAYTLWHLR